MLLNILLLMAVTVILTRELVLWDVRRSQDKEIKEYYENMKGWLEDYKKLKTTYGLDHFNTVSMKKRIIKEWRFFNLDLVFYYDRERSAEIITEFRQALFQEGIIVNASVVIAD